MKAAMHATVTHVPGGPFVGKADSGHAAVLDWSGGTDTAPSPVEMLLLSLGACSGIDVVSILQKARTPAESFRIEIAAERSEAHPRVFTKIHLNYRVAGRGLDRKQVERAVQLSKDKYCSATLMLGKTAAITYDIEIVEADRLPPPAGTPAA